MDRFYEYFTELLMQRKHWLGFTTNVSSAYLWKAAGWVCRDRGLLVSFLTPLCISFCIHRPVWSHYSLISMNILRYFSLLLVCKLQNLQILLGKCHHTWKVQRWPFSTNLATFSQWFFTPLEFIELSQFNSLIPAPFFHRPLYHKPSTKVTCKLLWSLIQKAGWNSNPHFQTLTMTKLCKFYLRL